MKRSVISIAAAAIVLGLSSSVRSAEPPDDTSTAIEEALDAAADALDDVANKAAEGGETVSMDDLEASGLWKPVTYYDPLIDDFIADVEPIAKGNAGRRQVVGAKYDLSAAALDEIISFLRQMEKDGYSDKQDATLRSRALRLVETGNRAPISLMISAAAIGHVGDNCTAGDVDVLMKGSRDPDADLWAIATSCTSSEAFAIALDRSVRARPALFYLLMDWTGSDPASELAALDIQLRRDALKQIGERSRDVVHADIARTKLGKLLDLGLQDEAIAFSATLNPHIRMLAFKRGGEKIRATIGGFNLQTQLYSGESNAADYAAALVLAGREAEARPVLDLVAPSAMRREARACLDAGKTECTVGEQQGVPLDALIVDQLLDRPVADPYVLIESGVGRHSSQSGSIVEAFCRISSTPEEQNACRDARESIAQKRAVRGDEDEDARALWAVIRKVGGQPFEQARSSYASKLAALGSVEMSKTDWSRASIDPEPVPFRELPVPAEALARKPSGGASPKGFGKLPDGFTLVRIERSGQRAAAISLSQRYDPNGEVTAGGYWLHLSDNGGQSWEAPLYSGLAEHFPYIVPARARLPLLAGDRVQLEVEEALIDTASIRYPPVGTRLKRKRKNIYLDIPIADLRKDSDGDGLSDIAARHLLLDRRAASGSPFLVGQEQNCSAPSSDTLARLEILKKIFDVEARALIEPAGPKKNLIGSWRKSSPSEKPPIFLRGNSDDYRCVVIDRPMIVYSNSDRDRLRKHSPDFQLIDLPPIQWNRDHSRGFVNWNMGWAGGTYRLIWEGNGWKLESIREWVS